MIEFIMSILKHNKAAAAKAALSFVGKCKSNRDNQQMIADKITSEIPTGQYYEERNFYKKKIKIWHLEV